MAFEKAPKDLLLVKKIVEEEVIPALDEKAYFIAQMTIGNILLAVDNIAISREHSGISLLASLRALKDALEKGQFGQVEAGILAVRAYLAQTLLYWNFTIIF